jgi:hypothetical protein
MDLATANAFAETGAAVVLADYKVNGGKAAAVEAMVERAVVDTQIGHEVVKGTNRCTTSSKEPRCSAVALRSGGRRPGTDY